MVLAGHAGTSDQGGHPVAAAGVVAKDPPRSPATADPETPAVVDPVTNGLQSGRAGPDEDVLTVTEVTVIP